MLNNGSQAQSSMEFDCIDELVPADHLLRKINRCTNFRFSSTPLKIFTVPVSVGRLRPNRAVKVLLVGGPFGVSAEWQPVCEMLANVLYCRFLGVIWRTKCQIL
jgi:hypothetical protein